MQQLQQSSISLGWTQDWGYPESQQNRQNHQSKTPKTYLS
jgi:hypothetical protein